MDARPFCTLTPTSVWPVQWGYRYSISNFIKSSHFPKRYYTRRILSLVPTFTIILNGVDWLFGQSDGLAVDLKIEHDVTAFVRPLSQDSSQASLGFYLPMHPFADITFVKVARTWIMI